MAFLILCEGETDALTLWLYGFPALGLPGASNAKCLSPEDVMGFDRIVICSEPDSAGQRFPIAVSTRLREVGFTGRIETLPFGPTGHKDVSALYLADPPGFRDTFDALLKGAEDNETTNARTRISIDLTPGKLPETVDCAEKVLIANAENLRLFQRGGEVVRIIALDQEASARLSKRDGLERHEGAVVLHPMSTTSLQETFDRLIAWQRTSMGGLIRPVDCPAKIAMIYLSRVGLWNLPHLLGVIEAPTIRPDGTVLTAAGYDRATRLYLNCANGWPVVPEHPSRTDAEDALRTLREPFAEFPFVGDADRSAHVAAILTGLIRRQLSSAPLFGYGAPQQRSGKSLLAESIGLIATGRTPAAAGVSREREELRKMITSTLREGHLIANLDNITQALDSPDLARAITQQVYSDRLLGTNSNLRLPTNMMWTATGNNLSFQGDMSVRALLCRIDARLERPEERQFQVSNLRSHLLEKREILVTAALTILRAYHVAGRPKQNVKPWGGFDQWSSEIREPLLWVGMADPCKTREQIVVNDPERDLAMAVLQAWHNFFGKRALTVAEIASESDTNPDLKGKLLAIAASREDPKTIDPRRLGSWCRSVEDRIYADLGLSREGSLRRAAVWRVSCVSSVSSEPVDPNQNSDGDPSSSGVEVQNPAETQFDRPEINSPNSHNSHDCPERVGLADHDHGLMGPAAPFVDREDFD